MKYLDRYTKGEHKQVWQELQMLGEQVFEEPYIDQAQAVAAETMQRVRRNCERIYGQLQNLGYVFDTFPGGARRDYVPDPLDPPSKQFQVDLDELESEAGPLPLSLKAFWQEVGAVDFVGMHPAWPDGLDPLVVYPPEGALDSFYGLEGDFPEGKKGFGSLAPDDLHKDNVSGGSPYGLYLPEPSMDFKFMYEPNKLLFLPYLRLAILKWGGFPGLEGTGTTFEPLNSLTADLEDF
jgi:hypothetical protein